MAKSRKPRLPFGITHLPRTCDTKASLIRVDDHLGKSDVSIQTWWNGEGFTLQIDSEETIPSLVRPPQSIDISWQEWEALKLLVKDITKKEERGPNE